MSQRTGGASAPASGATIRFGTDGWRGVIARDFTVANLRRVAQAVADYWTRTAPAPRQAMVGYDQRFLAETHAQRVAEVLAANGILTFYPPEAVPTPAVSYAIRDRGLCGALMITASHNPPEFSGVKLKADYAGPADPAIAARVEALIDASPVRSIPFPTAVQDGRIRVLDPRSAHHAALRRLVDLPAIRAARLRVVADSMHGCGGTLLAELLGARARPRGTIVTTIRAGRDVLFGGTNPEPIARNLAPLSRAVRQLQADVGLATDGDADRLGIVDDHGRYVSIQLVLALLLVHLVRHRHETGGVVVKSVNSTGLIDRVARAHGLTVVEVPIGFKHICQQMRERDVLLGGEESGGVGFRGHIPERDGLLANLLMLELLAVTLEPLSRLLADLQREYGRSAYDRVDIRYPLDRREALIERLSREPPAKLLGVPVAEVNRRDGVKYLAADGSWLMLRTSGTEPIVRIYAEAATAARVRALLAWGQARALRQPA